MDRVNGSRQWIASMDREIAFRERITQVTVQQERRRRASIDCHGVQRTTRAKPVEYIQPRASETESHSPWRSECDTTIPIPSAQQSKESIHVAAINSEAKN